MTNIKYIQNLILETHDLQQRFILYIFCILTNNSVLFRDVSMNVEVSLGQTLIRG